MISWWPWPIPLACPEACHHCQCLCPNHDQPGGNQRQGLWWTAFCYCWKEEKLAILGEFSARVQNVSCEDVSKMSGIDTCNNHGLPLLQTCAEHEILITNTDFHLFTHNRTSSCTYWYYIDYIIIMRRDMQDVWLTESICSAQCCPQDCPLSVDGNNCDKRTNQRFLNGELNPSTSSWSTPHPSLT